MIKPYTVV
jgi:hypothetical protein